MLDPNIRADFIPDREAHLRRMRRMIEIADIVKLSQEDLLWFGESGDAEAVARSWLALGLRLVVVTRGDGPAVACAKEFRVLSRPEKVRVVDTIGAGDTFNAGILVSLHEQGLLAGSGLSALSETHVRIALEFASRAAAVTVSRAGANPPWRSELT